MRAAGLSDADANDTTKRIAGRDVVRGVLRGAPHGAPWPDDSRVTQL
jgi:hypothetical protein